jgi:hypothetical protein
VLGFQRRAFGRRQADEDDILKHTGEHVAVGQRTGQPNIRRRSSPGPSGRLTPNSSTSHCGDFSQAMRQHARAGINGSRGARRAYHRGERSRPMRIAIFSLSLALSAGVALAQPISENPPTKTIQCIEVGGQLIPPVCQVPASRWTEGVHLHLHQRRHAGGRVDLPEGVKPPPEGKKLDIARSAGVKDGTWWATRSATSRSASPRAEP